MSLSDFSLLVYQKARDCCILILYLVTLLYSFIDSSNFLVDIFRIFYVEDHVICKQWEFYFSFSNLDSIYFSSLIAVARTSKIMLSRGGESGHPCLVSDFRGCCSVVQSCLTLCHPMDCNTPGLSFPHHLLNLPKFMFIASVMLSIHLILWHPLLLLPSIFPSIRDFSNKSAIHIRWPKYWSFSFNISPSNE